MLDLNADLDDVSAIMVKGFWYNVVAGSVVVEQQHFASDSEYLSSNDTSPTVTFQYRRKRTFYEDPNKMSIRASLIEGVQYRGGSR